MTSLCQPTLPFTLFRSREELDLMEEVIDRLVIIFREPYGDTVIDFGVSIYVAWKTSVTVRLQVGGKHTFDLR
jgi:hypothetical protein